MLDTNTIRYGSTAITIMIMLLWIGIVVLAFIFFARTSTVSGERFNLSLGFALLSVFCPPFAAIPICLNSN